MILIVLSLVAFAHDVADRMRERFSIIEGDYASHQLRRIGDQTFQLESWISTEGELKTASEILSHYDDYPKWVMPNINRKPGGGEFFVKVLSIAANAGLAQLTVTFEISVSRFSHTSTRTFQLAFSSTPQRTTLIGTSLEDNSSIVSNAQGALTVLADPARKNRLWIHLIGKAKLRSALLYALLPDAPVQGEAGTRINQIIDNYLDWESHTETRRTSLGTPPP